MSYNRTLLWSGENLASSFNCSEPTTNFERIEVLCCSFNGSDYGNIYCEIDPFIDTTASQKLYGIKYYSNSELEFMMAATLQWKNSTSGVIGKMGVLWCNPNNMNNPSYENWNSHPEFKNCIKEVWGINRK